MGSACQIGASAKADAFLLSKTKINLLNVPLLGNCVSQTFPFGSEKLTFLIAISHACLLVSRTRTRKRDARARARSTQVPRA